jgi:hypothetical protein
MNYLTNYYKNLCEHLQERINTLEMQLNENEGPVLGRLTFEQWAAQTYGPMWRQNFGESNIPGLKVYYENNWNEPLPFRDVKKIIEKWNKEKNEQQRKQWDKDLKQQYELHTNPSKMIEKMDDTLPIPLEI